MADGHLDLSLALLRFHGALGGAVDPNGILAAGPAPAARLRPRRNV